MLKLIVYNSHPSLAYLLLKIRCYFLLKLVTLRHRDNGLFKANILFFPPSLFLPSHLPPFPFQYVLSLTPAYHSLVFEISGYIFVFLDKKNKASGSVQKSAVITSGYTSHCSAWLPNTVRYLGL